MEKREQIIRLWFDMWLEMKDRGIEGIFARDCVYIESWGPKYLGTKAVKRWFDDWNKSNRVLIWDIKQFFHRDQQTVVEWFFKCEMEESKVDGFDGVSIIRWDQEDRIRYLKEFGCKLPNYEPYHHLTK